MRTKCRETKCGFFIEMILCLLFEQHTTKTKLPAYNWFSIFYLIPTSLDCYVRRMDKDCFERTIYRFLMLQILLYIV